MRDRPAAYRESITSRYRPARTCTAGRAVSYHAERRTQNQERRTNNAEHGRHRPWPRRKPHWNKPDEIMTDPRNPRPVGGHGTRKNFPLDKTRGIPLRKQVADRLRHALIAGDLQPGEILSAPALAAEFEVSATPVREAMLDLATEGHVKPIRYKGYRVVEISPDTRANILQLRALIEIPLMMQVARDGVSADELDQAVRTARLSVEAAQRGDLVDFIRLDMELHLGLLAATGNDVAVRHVRSLRYMTRLTGLQDLVATERLWHTAQEHFELVEAVRSSDPRAMETVISRHLGHISGVWAGSPED